MNYNEKIIVVLRDDLAMWQKLNVTSFTISGIASQFNQYIGKPYEDGSGQKYLPMFTQPVMIFKGNKEQLKAVHQKVIDREWYSSIFTNDLFTTDNDTDNRAQVEKEKSEDLDVVGMAIVGPKNPIDKMTKKLTRHE